MYATDDIIQSIQFDDPAIQELIRSSLVGLTPSAIADILDEYPSLEHLETPSALESPTTTYDEISTNGRVTFDEIINLVSNLVSESDKVSPVESPVSDKNTGSVSFIDMITNLINIPISNSLDKFSSIEDVLICSQSIYPIHIAVVGCGGTGSRLINSIAQLMLSNSRIKLHLYDFDTIEYKNLSRQNFYEFELGDNKALALKNRYESLYGIFIDAYDRKFIANDINTYLRQDINTYLIQDIRETLVIFDCTDNLDARQEIEKSFHLQSLRTYSECALISCGNQKDFGQVHFAYRKADRKFGMKNTKDFHSSMSHLWNSSISNLIKLSGIELTNFLYMQNVEEILINMDDVNRSIYLSTFLEYNKDFKDSAESISCTNMNIAEEQSLAINSTIAQIAFNMLFEFISGNGIKHNIIWANLTNSYSGNCINTFDQLLDYNTKSIFGKSIALNMEPYKHAVLNMANNINDVYTSINTAYEFGRINSDLIYNDYFSKYLKRSNYYSLNSDTATLIRDSIYNDLSKYVSDNITLDITKENFPVAYLRYIIFINVILYIFTMHVSNRQYYGLTNLVNQVFPMLCSDYTKFVEKYESEYNLILSKKWS